MSLLSNSYRFLLQAHDPALKSLLDRVDERHAVSPGEPSDLAPLGCRQVPPFFISDFSPLVPVNRAPHNLRPREPRSLMNFLYPFPLGLRDSVSDTDEFTRQGCTRLRF